MDLNRIAVFARVVDAGSFTAAAAALGVRKSSVSRSVAALEAELGIRLLQRTTRRLALTDAGRAYYDRARDALAALDDAGNAVSSLGTEPRGQVRVTAPVDLAGDLATVTTAFARAYPAVRVEVSLSPRVVDLVKEGFDLAVRGGPLTDSSLLSQKIGESELGLFASPAYLDAAGRPRRLADLARHECILHRSGSGAARWRLTGPRGEEEVVAHGRVDTDELAFVRSMVLAGFGIALTPITPVHVVWPPVPASTRRAQAAIRSRSTVPADAPVCCARAV